ncbi:aminotransferase class I and II [Planomonospora sp. ID91781]|uniref:Aminotransferase class I and II n=1 Tax=Planomonospora sphaerica TaxID=161355 RepID=A0A171CNI2_9ACTN|nr:MULTISPECIES: HipA family kinase [Planomonospora]MBG0821443.1 aminotransferase class I and II [Planomonospora sp. ID91781]GAT66982.1 aminotransferase class I and II [Planomonospora sphaerica]
MLEEIAATRYVTPLREGGSLPGVMEADDLGTYAVKFRGAGQGRRVLVAEVLCAELARRLGFRTPELKVIDVDPQLGAREPDEEIQDLLKASAGRNLAVDFLPGALGFEPLAWPPDPALASRLLWFDALIHNVDRSWRNPNLLLWHGDVWLIDHGAALWFHHNWRTADPQRGFDAGDHVLAPFATEMAAADAELSELITPDLLDAVTGEVPGEWLEDEPGFADAQAVRRAYAEHLLARAHGPRAWLPGPAAGPPQDRREQKTGSIGTFWKGAR